MPCRDPAPSCGQGRVLGARWHPRTQHPNVQRAIVRVSHSQGHSRKQGHRQLGWLCHLCCDTRYGSAACPDPRAARGGQGRGQGAHWGAGAGLSLLQHIVGGAAGGARPASGTERHSCGQCPRPPRRGPAAAARWGLISSFESRGGNRAAPGPPLSPEWRGRPQRSAHPGNRHRTGVGDTGRRDRGRDRGLEGLRDRGMQLPPSPRSHGTAAHPGSPVLWRVGGS